MNTNVFENVKKVRILYCCVFSDKEIAKSEGFHWEPEQKRWYDEFSLGTNEENGIKELFLSRISKNFPIIDVELYDFNDINIDVTKDDIDKYLRISRYYDNSNERRSNIGIYMQEKNRRLKNVTTKTNSDYQFGKRRK